MMTPPAVMKIFSESFLSFFYPSFYRHVLEAEVAFQTDGSFSPGPMAKFLDMPQSPLFTLNLNTPESWMVESVHTRYDLDNIYLEEVRQYVCLGSVWIDGQSVFVNRSLAVNSEVSKL